MIDFFHIIALSGDIITDKCHNFEPILTFLKFLYNYLTAYLCGNPKLVVELCDGNRLNVVFLYLFEHTLNAFLQIGRDFFVPIPYFDAGKTNIFKPESRNSYREQY